MGDAEAFFGAKLALFVGGRLAVILRDDFEGLAYAGCWDFPGGGREGAETPLDCALRECSEELGIVVPRDAVVWERAYVVNAKRSWFFAAHLPADAGAAIVLGDEGQCWRLMTPAQFLAQDKAVTFLQVRLGEYLASAVASGH